jgi:hypothetical protein
MCDDGNRLDGDDCSANCLETPTRVLNQTTASAQYYPDLAGSPERFILAYTTDEVPGIDDDGKHVRVSKIDPDGNPMRTGDGLPWDMAMNTVTGASQEQASAAVFGNSLTAVWLDFNMASTTEGDARVRTVELDMGRGDPEAILNETVEGMQLDAVIAGNGTSSSMLAAWTTSHLPPTDVMCRRVVDGVASGSEFACMENADGDESDPAVAVGPDGRLAVAWTEAGDGLDVYVRFFDAGGTAVSGDLRANTTTAGDQTDASIAFDASGRLLVVWRDVQPSASPTVRARLFGSPGTATGDDFAVSQGPIPTQEDSAVPDVAGDAGVFLVVWYVQGVGVRGRLVSGQGAFAVNRVNPKAAVGPFTDTGEFVVAGDAPRMKSPTTAVAASGKALVAWSMSPGADQDIHGRIIPTN